MACAKLEERVASCLSAVEVVSCQQLVVVVVLLLGSLVLYHLVVSEQKILAALELLVLSLLTLPGPTSTMNQHWHLCRFLLFSSAWASQLQTSLQVAAPQPYPRRLCSQTLYHCCFWLDCPVLEVLSRQVASAYPPCRELEVRRLLEGQMKTRFCHRWQVLICHW